MKSVARDGQDTVYYDYDAGGRLVRRTKDSEVTMSYWLGLNKIAEETVVDLSGLAGGVTPTTKPPNALSTVLNV